MDVSDGRTYRFALRISDCLIDTKDQARRLGGAADRVYFHQARFPYKRFHVVADALRPVYVHAIPLRTVGVLHAQLVQYVRGIDTGVVADLTRNDLERLGERRHDKLELSGNGKGMFAYVGRDVHL